MNIDLVEDLYKQKIAELYDAEKQTLRLLPKIIKATENPELRGLLEEHTKETKAQAQRLEQLISKRGVEEAKKSKGMAGLLGEAKDLLSQGESADPELLGLALALAEQAVESFEMTAYASAQELARLLNYDEDLRALEQNYKEERNMADRIASLTQSVSLEEVENETETDMDPQHTAAA